MKKYIFFMALCLFFSSAPQARAGMVINEIMYDLTGTDTGREWVEVYNSGTDAVDLSSFKFVEGGSNHGLVPDASASIPALGYGIIADNAANFKTDNPSYTGVIFDSTFSLSNTVGETLALKDGTGTVVDSISYTPPSEPKEGKTIGLLSGSWALNNPTPGAVNVAADSDAGGGTTGGTDADIVTKPKEEEVPRITMDIEYPAIVMPRIEAKLQARVYGYSKEPLMNGRFIWNFGDGQTYIKDGDMSVFHTYKYPGEYVVSVMYYGYSYALTSLIEDRVVITVVATDLSVSRIGTPEDPFVELKNTSTHEIDLGGWSIEGGTSVFTFPQKTIVLPGKTLIFASEITHFNYADIAKLTIRYPNSSIALTYGQSVPKTIIHASSTNRSISAAPAKTSQTSETMFETPIAFAEADTGGLSASQSAVVEQALPKNKTKLWIWILFAILVIGGITTTVLLFNKKESESEDNYEIIE